MSNTLLEPIHGVTLFDYAAVSAKIAAGISQSDVLNTLGIEVAIYEEASALWVARMQEDSTWEVTMEFGKYFGEVDNHPKLKNLKVATSDEGNQNLEKLKTDRYFYEELCGARQAAHEYGIDGAQWVLDNYDINLGDFQSVAMHWANDNQKYMAAGDHESIMHFANYLVEKQEEYAEKFAEEQGGNVADDIDF
jgi:hypothetical protein